VSDIEHTASELVDGAMDRCLPRFKPAMLKAIIRRASDVLAGVAGHDDAAQVHTSLGHQHFRRSRGFR
jgi:hypothetical protein